jgi:hypothetical protein
MCVCNLLLLLNKEQKQKSFFESQNIDVWKQEPKDQCISARVKGKKWK